MKATDEGGRTPLHVALEHRNELEVLQLFLKPTIMEQQDKKKTNAIRCCNGR